MERMGETADTTPKEMQEGLQQNCETSNQRQEDL
jgi:hypothetical protein